MYFDRSQCHNRFQNLHKMYIKFSVVNVVFIWNFINLAFAQNNTDLSDFKVVQTENGFVRGKKLWTLFAEKPYYSFKGIRYAKAPVNELRFKVKLSIFLQVQKRNS